MPRETVIINGRTHDKLTCAWCGKEFTRESSVHASRLPGKPYCNVVCSRKASNQRWKEGGGSDAYARFKNYKEQTL